MSVFKLIQITQRRKARYAGGFESSRMQHNNDNNNKQSSAMRQVTVRVSQGLPLSMAVIGRTSAEMNFLQHHIALRLTIKHPTLSTYQNHRNSLQ